MKKIITAFLCAVLMASLSVSLCSCDLYNDIFGGQETPTRGPSSANGGTTSAKISAQLITDPPATATAAAGSLYLGVLKNEKSKDGTKTVFLYDGNGDGAEELFIVTAFESRGICDVYYAENGKAEKTIDGCEIFDGKAEEYYAGIAVKDKRNYLFTYAKTRYGSEYTVRYSFTDLVTAKTATVAEDYRKKDGSTDKSVHEYSVNGESVTENDYIVSREAYSIVCATADTGKNGVKTVGSSVSDIITELENR